MLMNDLCKIISTSSYIILILTNTGFVYNLRFKRQRDQRAVYIFLQWVTLKGFLQKKVFVR